MEKENLPAVDQIATYIAASLIECGALRAGGNKDEVFRFDLSGMKSLDLVSVLVSVEQFYGFQFSPEEFAEIVACDVLGLAKLVNTRIAGIAPGRGERNRPR